MLGGASYNRFRQFIMHWLPNYGPTYYAAFVHDPEGNNIEAMLACVSDSSTATKPDPVIRNVLMARPVIFPENKHLSSRMETRAVLR